MALSSKKVQGETESNCYTMGTEEDYSQIQNALASIGLSAALIFSTDILRQGIGLLSRIAMARYLPIAGYGNFAVGLALLELSGIVALAGIPVGLSRYLPRQQTDQEQRDFLSISVQIVGIMSVILMVSIFLAAGPVATFVFGEKDLVWVIRIFSAVLPFYAIFNLSIGGFRGYEQTYPRVLTQNILRPGLQLLGVLLCILIGYNTVGIAFAYAGGFVGVAVISVIILYRISELSVQDLTRRSPVGRYRELLAFSLPLVVWSGTWIIAKNSDLIILGIFKSGSQVGLYDVVFRMGLVTVSLFAPALGYLFQPIVSRFEMTGKWKRIDELYTVVTRWSVVATIPVFSLFFLFPGQIIGAFFGPKYQSGQVILQILLVGFMGGMLPGMTTNFLTGVGDTKPLMYISIGVMLLNILLNIALIPTYGVIGASTATVAARILGNSVQSYYIYDTYGVNPFNRKYTLPIGLMITVIASLYFFPIGLSKLNVLEALLVSTGLGLVFIFTILITRSIYNVEITLLDAFLDKIGVSIQISSYLKPFAR